MRKKKEEMRKEKGERKTKECQGAIKVKHIQAKLATGSPAKVGGMI